MGSIMLQGSGADDWVNDRFSFPGRIATKKGQMRHTDSKTSDGIHVRDPFNIIGQTRPVIARTSTSASACGAPKADSVDGSRSRHLSARVWRPRIMWDDQHQMGTTRMHNNPKFGVADQNCRIWNIENIFVAGSSVFPTSGISINFTLYAR